MTYALAILTILASAVAGGLLSLFVQARLKVAHRKAHQESGTVVFLQLGVVFAVLLAFVFNSCWEGYNDAAGSIDLECGALHGASMIAVTLPPEQARDVLSLEAGYIRSVVTSEWRHMERFRTESIATDDALALLIEEVARLQVGQLDGRANRNEIQALIERAHAQREARIFQADQGVPIALWTVLFAFTALLVLFVSLSPAEHRLVAVGFTATFASASAAILVMAHLLDYPFEGALRLKPDDFVSVLHKVDLLLAAVPAA